MKIAIECLDLPWLSMTSGSHAPSPPFMFVTFKPIHTIECVYHFLDSCNMSQCYLIHIKLNIYDAEIDAVPALPNWSRYGDGLVRVWLFHVSFRTECLGRCSLTFSIETNVPGTYVVNSQDD